MPIHTRGELSGEVRSRGYRGCGRDIEFAGGKAVVAAIGAGFGGPA